jgi:acetolactate synthase-1/2/3 large subunit
MNGAESLVRTLVASGVDICFANPGTSEMHFVAALDHVPGVRCVLALAEGVVTGAADGYARIAGKPAATLLHLGPGMANGLSNLHNARKANSPVVNVIGEHATYHLQYDAPLTSDLDGIARPVSHWVGRAQTADDVARLGAEAVAAARSQGGQIASLILPANTAWEAASGVAQPVAPSPRPKAEEAAILAGAAALKRGGEKAMLLLGGQALHARALMLAGRIQAATGCRLSGQGSNARIERGPHLPEVGRIPFVVDQALAYLKDVAELVMVGAKIPVAFFAYPGKPSLLAPASCGQTAVASLDYDLEDALERLADALGAPRQYALRAKPALPAMPSGAVSLDGIAAVIANLLPDNTVVVDESVTSGRGIFAALAGGPRHDWLQNMGGSIGYSMPVALGAALAAPERKVLSMTGDGSAFYTLQALWSMAREQLDVTVIVFANRRYAILQGELANVGAANPGPRAIDMLTLNRPDPDWVKLAEGHGVAAERATDLDGFAAALRRAFGQRGPRLIELVF